ncbi:TolB family protein [Brevibacillus migulae]|uniref:TolB family protein n=1 Tax=Brevibacillus migulae TaxID=1644114 RepID=UPI0014302ACA|nr:PD40 domain-containing protein [Brevibacillus migulae]
MKDDKHLREEMHDSTISDLLQHLTQLRQKVPVNYQLKADLKAQLLERMREMERMQAGRQVVKVVPWWRKKRWMAGGAILLGLSFSLFFWCRHFVISQEEALNWLPPIQAVEQIALAPNGEQIAYVADGARLFLRSLQDEKEILRFQLPATKGDYQAVSWANRMDRLAVVEESGDITRIWLINASEEGGHQASSRLLIEEPGTKFSTPDWSPDNRLIAYTRRKGTHEEVWVNSTVSLEKRKVADGSQPAWSPSGAGLAYVHDGMVSVIDLASGQVQEVGAGKWPDWLSDDRLVFTTSNGNLAEARLHEKPVQIVSLPIPSGVQDKIVRTNWSSNQEDVLIAYQSVHSLAFSVAKRR